MRCGKLLIGGLLVALAAFGPKAAGQPPPDPVVDVLHARVGQFLQAVALGTLQTAYEELLAGSPLAQQTEALTNLTEQTARLEDRCGEYRAFERIDAERVGNDLVVMTYLYKCENYPVAWRFVFYRTPSRGTGSAENEPWRVIGVRFDTDLELLER